MTIVTTIITSTAGLDVIVDDWRALLDRCVADTIFLTPEWVYTWLDTCDGGEQPFFVAAHMDGKLVGLAPFYLSRIRFLGAVSFSCLRVAADQNTSAEYQDLLLDQEHADAALAAIADALHPQVKEFSFVWIPFCDRENGATRRFQRLFERLGLDCRSRDLDYYTVPLPGSKDAFDNELSTKQRNNIRRYRRRLETTGQIRLVNLAGQVSPEEIFAILTSLHARRWQSRGEAGAFVRKPAFARFTKAFLPKATERGWLVALCLYQDELPVAIRFGYAYKKVIFEIQAGFSPEYNGSGIVSIDMAIEHAIERGIVEYDFLASSGEYKNRFSARSKRGDSLFATRRGALRGLLFRIFWPTGRFVRQL